MVLAEVTQFLYLRQILHTYRQISEKSSESPHHPAAFDGVRRGIARGEVAVTHGVDESAVEAEVTRQAMASFVSVEWVHDGRQKSKKGR